MKPQRTITATLAAIALACCCASAMAQTYPAKPIRVLIGFSAGSEIDTIGRLVATADFNAMRMAALATECAVRHLRGGPVPEEIELAVEIVDRSNYHRWDLPFEQRPIPTLKETLA